MILLIVSIQQELPSNPIAWQQKQDSLNDNFDQRMIKTILILLLCSQVFKLATIYFDQPWCSDELDTLIQNMKHLQTS